MNVLGKIADLKYRFLGGGIRHEPLRAHVHGFVFLPNPVHPDYRDMALCDVSPTGIRILKTDSREYRAAYMKIERDLYACAIAEFYSQLYKKETWYFENISLYQVDFHLHLRSEPGSFLIAAKATPKVSEINLHYLDAKRKRLRLQIMYKTDSIRNCRVYKIYNTKLWHESLLDLVSYAQNKELAPLGIKLADGVRPFGTTK